MDEFERKILLFATAIKDVYKDDDERELQALGKLEMDPDTLTEDFTAMLYGMYALYSRISEDECDIIDFTHLLNKLAFQYLMGNGKENEKRH